MTGPDRDTGLLQEPGCATSGRDSDVIRTISEQELSVFTFDGLRRLLGAHPETLSRSLDRLEESGMLTKSPDGYTTTPRAKIAYGIKAAAASGRWVALLHTFLPYGASQRVVVSALKGRWFDKMRWVGMTETDEGSVLKWVTDDGTVLINAKFESGQLDIEARVSKDSDIPGAVRAAHQLVARISRMYQSPRPGAAPSFLRIGHFTSRAM